MNAPKINSPRPKLVDCRKRQGLTQEELARKAEITRAYLANIESGKHTPSLKVALKISTVLEESIDELFL
jgi:putative transcriptional regulator